MIGDNRREFRPTLCLSGRPARGTGMRWINMDVVLAKDIAITETKKLQFRAEAFNVCNTPEFNNPDTSLQSATFGKITSQRNIPRQIQFGLKIVF